MSRSAEEALALEERIRRMKLNSERLRKRHLEVEEDKLHAAQQNALVQVVSPPGNDWVIRNRNSEFEYVDNRSPPQPPSEGFGDGRGRGRGRGWGRGEPRKSWSNEHDDRAVDEPRPRRNAPGFEQRPGRDRWSARTPSNAPGNYGNSGNMVIGNWEDPAEESRGTPPRRSNQGVIPSKVFSNTSLEGQPHKAKYRLSEGEGPPPDPSYSFLDDSMRNGGKVPERRKENNHGMSHRSERGPGSGRTVVNQGSKRSPMSQKSYEEWRRERDAIDQRRIDRQKTSDGHWSREWDNDKIVQNDPSPPRYSGGDNWGTNRRRHNNRFGDFLDDSLSKRTGNRPNHNLNTSGSSDSNNPEKDGASHDQRNFKGRQPRRQFSNEGHVDKSSYDTPPSESRACFGTTKPMSPGTGRLEGRLEAARRASGPVLSTLRQFDTDVCTVTLPSSIPVKGNNRAAGPSSPASSPASSPVSSPVSPDKSGQASSDFPSPTLKVSVRTDENGKRTRVVEGVGCPDLTTLLRDSKKTPEGAASPKKRRQRIAKTRKMRLSQLSVSKEGDESWEDLSSEDDVSFVADLPGPSTASLEPQLATKSQDVSSGPESLDPIPSTNKEEELLWEEFHPAGFQNNMTLAMVTEAAYKALLSKGEATEENSEEKSEGGSAKLSVDAAEKSEEIATKLDPILVVTQIVKAEVDCMSLTSLTTDSSLPEDINLVPCETEARCEEPPSQALNADAEELSGPVSILEITPQQGKASSDTDGSFQSADSPKSQITVNDTDNNDESNSDVETDIVDLAKVADEQVRPKEEGTQSEEAGQNTEDDSECGEDIIRKKTLEVDLGNQTTGVEIDESEDRRTVGSTKVEDEDSKNLKSEQAESVSDTENNGNDCERQKTENLDNRSPENSETLNEDSLSIDTEAVRESRENVDSESTQSLGNKSDPQEKVTTKHIKDTSELSSGDKTEGAKKSVEETTNDKKTKSETNADSDSEAASQSSEMNR